MPTSFPTTVDTYSTKLDGVSDVLAADTNNLQDAVLALQAKVGVNSSTVTTSVDYKLRNILNDVVATPAVGAVGTYAACRTSGEVLPGATIAGSSLEYAGVNSVGVTVSGTPPGTWRCMGYTINNRLTMYLRIS